MAKFPKNFSKFLIKLKLSQFHYKFFFSEFNMSLSDRGPVPSEFTQ